MKEGNARPYADGIARQLTRQYTASVLMARIELFERLLRAGLLKVRKTPAHALVHLIRHPDRYPHHLPSAQFSRTAK